MELAELLVGTVAHADWAMFSKNGTDATTTCVTLARAGHGRRKVLVARGAYHGAVPWCTPSLAGVTAEDRAHLIHFDYNDVASLEAGRRARRATTWRRSSSRRSATTSAATRRCRRPNSRGPRARSATGRRRR